MHRFNVHTYNAQSSNVQGKKAYRDNMPKGHAGVTLIELVAVLALVGLMFSLALPSFRDMVGRNRSATQVNEFLVAIILARSEALKIGSSVSVQASASASGNEFGGGWCVVVANPGNCNAPVIRTFPALTNAAILDSVEDNSAIVFNSYGELASGLVQNIDLCVSGSADRRIFINLIGRPSAHRPNDASVSKRPSCP